MDMELYILDLTRQFYASENPSSNLWLFIFTTDIKAEHFKSSLWRGNSPKGKEQKIRRNSLFLKSQLNWSDRWLKVVTGGGKDWGKLPEKKMKLWWGISCGGSGGTCHPPCLWREWHLQAETESREANKRVTRTGDGNKSSKGALRTWRWHVRSGRPTWNGVSWFSLLYSLLSSQVKGGNERELIATAAQEKTVP